MGQVAVGEGSCWFVWVSGAGRLLGRSNEEEGKEEVQGLCHCCPLLA